MTAGNSGYGKLGARENAGSTTPAIFIGKWTVRILSLLEEQPHRHGQLRRRLGSISQRMLTRNLRNLESAGLITRYEKPATVMTVHYSITRLGRTFLGPLTRICRWAHQHQKELTAVVHLVESGESDT